MELMESVNSIVNVNDQLYSLLNPSKIFETLLIMQKILFLSIIESKLRYNLNGYTSLIILYTTTYSQNH